MFEVEFNKSIGEYVVQAFGVEHRFGLDESAAKDYCDEQNQWLFEDLYID